MSLRTKGFIINILLLTSSSLKHNNYYDTDIKDHNNKVNTFPVFKTHDI
jgi:hypothetical protein